MLVQQLHLQSIWLMKEELTEVNAPNCPSLSLTFLASRPNIECDQHNLFFIDGSLDPGVQFIRIERVEQVGQICR